MKKIYQQTLAVAVILAAAGCGTNPFACAPGMPPAAPAAPAAKPAPAPIAPVQHTVLESKPITITGINFQTNSSQLISHDIAVLDQVADFAHKHADAMLDVNGYCSKTGSFAYNQKLSEQRAQSVAGYLEAHGVNASRIVTKGHSYLDPVASNATAKGRFMNQRVEINSSIKVRKTVQ
ncbi:OmpA family protein [Acidithiobacillus montserratensis]|uniref:OmpA family protein n=1 Tax=Acidithiobacillus montserratensis TaxID=2729135 RepID=A0ACD5HGX5_9PROT|nr:OmpA family protein [Acidithiobacillaceae bacterium]